MGGCRHERGELSCSVHEFSSSGSDASAAEGPRPAPTKLATPTCQHHAQRRQRKRQHLLHPLAGKQAVRRCLLRPPALCRRHRRCCRICCRLLQLLRYHRASRRCRDAFRFVQHHMLRGLAIALAARQRRGCRLEQAAARLWRRRRRRWVAAGWGGASRAPPALMTSTAAADTPGDAGARLGDRQAVLHGCSAAEAAWRRRRGFRCETARLDGGL